MSSRRESNGKSLPYRCGILLLVSVVAGCGGSKGKLSGQVRYDGQPLPGGRVTFRPANPKVNPVSVDLDEQGNYQVALPVGEVQVSVDNRGLQPRPAPLAGSTVNLPPAVREAMNKAKTEGATPAPAAAADNPSAAPKTRGKYVAIPPKYYTIEDSGLKYTIESGNQKQDIELKSGP
jgi:hypothetical protein